MSNDQPTGSQPEQPDTPATPPSTPTPDPYAQPPAYGQQPPPYGDAAYGQPEAFDPAGAGYGQPAEPPASILNAVKLMYVGAVLAAITTILSLFVIDRDALIEDAVEQSDLTRDQAETAVSAFTTTSIVIGIISIALWVWMATMNKRGRGWARVVATVLGGLNIVFILVGLSQPTSGLNLVFNLVSVVLAAAILYLLYRRDSSEYYAAHSRRR